MLQLGALQFDVDRLRLGGLQLGLRGRDIGPGVDALGVPVLRDLQETDVVLNLPRIEVLLALRNAQGEIRLSQQGVNAEARQTRGPRRWLPPPPGRPPRCVARSPTGQIPNPRPAPPQRCCPQKPEPHARPSGPGPRNRRADRRKQGRTGDRGRCLRLPVLRRRHLQRCAGDFNPVLQPVQHGIAVDLPPFLAGNLVGGFRGFPIAGLLEGRRLHGRAVVIGADGTAGEDEEGKTGGETKTAWRHRCSLGRVAACRRTVFHSPGGPAASAGPTDSMAALAEDAGDAG